MKTEVIFLNDQHQESFKKGDIGYIDGYVTGGDGRPYAIVVRDSDGHVGYAYTYNLKACGFVSVSAGLPHDNATGHERRNET